MDMIDIYFEQSKISYVRLIASIAYLSYSFLVLLAISIFILCFGQSRFVNCMKGFYETEIIKIIINYLYNHINNRNNNAFSSDRRNQREVNDNNCRIHLRQKNQEDAKNNIDNVNNIIYKKSNEKIRNTIESESNACQTEMLRLKHKSLCSICLSNYSEIILAPCGHRCLCQECYKKVKYTNKNCPICKQKIITFVEKVYDT